MLHDQVVIITGGAQGMRHPAQEPCSRQEGACSMLTVISGIGRAAASLLAENGAKIAISDIDTVKSEAAVRDLRDAGRDAISVPGDLLSESFPRHLVENVLKKWGKVNCLVNNAGQYTFPVVRCVKLWWEHLLSRRPRQGFCFDSAIHKMDQAKFDVIMKIHNYVPFRLIQSLAEHWMSPGNRDMPKSIVNISSTSGLHGAMGQINYSTAKAGINGMTKTVATEWGR